MQRSLRPCSRFVRHRLAPTLAARYASTSSSSMAAPARVSQLVPSIELTPDESRLVHLLTECADWVDQHPEQVDALRLTDDHGAWIGKERGDEAVELRIAGGWVRDKVSSHRLLGPTHLCACWGARSKKQRPYASLCLYPKTCDRRDIDSVLSPRSSSGDSRTTLTFRRRRIPSRASSLPRSLSATSNPSDSEISCVSKTRESLASSPLEAQDR